MLDAAVALSWQLDPLEALRRWPADRPVVLLHSGRFEARWARYSLLAEPIGAYRFVMTADQAGRSQWLGAWPDDRAQPRWRNDPLRDLAAAVGDDSAMWIGYLGYDVARFIEVLPSRAQQDRDWPVTQFQRCPGWLVHDGKDQRWYAAGDWADGSMPNLPGLEPGNTGFCAQAPVSECSRAEHEARVARAIQYIAAGDIFQVNLAQRFTAKLTGSMRGLLPALAERSPAWYGAYIELLRAATDEPRRALVSTSPELFLEVNAAGTVITRPIKGTRPGHVSAEELARSEKDAAELHMIVDLMRNDLGRVCAYGSVRVGETRRIESHPTVHHGVATVTGRLRPGATVFDLLAATMPGGSVTGVPKVRAMQIIDELEKVRRGPYCGAMGYLRGRRDNSGGGDSSSGRSDGERGGDGGVVGGVSGWVWVGLNIAIRTMLVEMEADVDRGRVDFSVGGGIVADSMPGEEYQETLDKAAAMISALSSLKTVGNEMRTR